MKSNFTLRKHKDTIFSDTIAAQLVQLVEDFKRAFPHLADRVTITIVRGRRRGTDAIIHVLSPAGAVVATLLIEIEKYSSGKDFDVKLGRWIGRHEDLALSRPVTTLILGLIADVQLEHLRALAPHLLAKREMRVLAVCAFVPDDNGEMVGGLTPQCVAYINHWLRAHLGVQNAEGK